MALNANALLTIEEARAAFGLTDSAHDGELERVINRASDLAENVYCHRALKQRTITALRVEGPRSGCHLYPAAWPIDPAGTVVVVVNGTTQTLWTAESDGDPDDFDVQVYPDHFYRAQGWAPTGQTRRNVVLTYDGGYDPVPEDLKVAAVELVLKLYGPTEQQRPDFASMSGPGGSLQTLDGQWAGSASGTPWSLTRRSKEVFESYRRVGVG